MATLSDLLDAASQLSWRRLFAALVLLALVGTGIGLFEIYTHSMRLDRSERALNLAQKAEAYRSAIGKGASSQQIAIYKAAMATAQAATDDEGLDSEVTRTQLKFLCGALPWLLMALIFIGGKGDGRFTGMFGAVVFGALAASFLAYLPDWAWPIGNLVLAPTFAWLVVVGTFSLIVRRQKRRSVA